MRRLAPLLLVALVACGGHDHGAQSAPPGTDRIEIDMRDIAFAPERISVPAGEVVTLVFRNTGKVAHEAFIGDEAAQREHAREMKEGGDDHHEGHAAVTVEPGEEAELTHTFEADERTFIGCHEPGHYDAGMRVTVDVRD